MVLWCYLIISEYKKLHVSFQNSGLLFNSVTVTTLSDVKRVTGKR